MQFYELLDSVINSIVYLFSGNVNGNNRCSESAQAIRYKVLTCCNISHGVPVKVDSEDVPTIICSGGLADDGHTLQGNT